MSANKIQRAEAIQAALPEGGLFHEKSWRVSPDAFVIGRKLTEEIDKLGYRLTRFVRACNQLYRFSVSGRQPSWIAELLDRGKPAELVALQRERALAMAVPKVIRPDLILTEGGYIIAELDNVPGGIGLTAWLDQIYSDNGAEILEARRACSRVLLRSYREATSLSRKKRPPIVQRWNGWPRA